MICLALVPEHDDSKLSWLRYSRWQALVIHRPSCQKISVKVQMHVDLHISTLTHTHLFNGPLSGTARVSRYQKGKTSLHFTVTWQWHQLGRMQVCTSLQSPDR